MARRRAGSICPDCYRWTVPCASPGGAAKGGRTFMTVFSLGTFGFPEVHTDGRPIKLALRKGLALLVYLAEAKGAVSRGIVATLLWPETDRETGLARLRRLLHRIELTLGQQVFETDRTSLRLSPDIELKIDSHLFESACDRGDFEKACRMYR